MKITNVKIKKVLPNKGLVGFASCVIEDSLYLGGIAVYTRLGETDRMRIVFPTKDVLEKKIEMFYPLNAKLYYLLEQIITDKYKEKND